MNAAELNVCINARRNLRTRIAVLYNSRINFCNFSAIERSAKKSHIQELYKKLEQLNKDFQLNKVSSASDEEVQKEYETCWEYESKIHECIAHLDALVGSITNNSNSDVARSFLKSPVAPLPRFNGNEDEDYDKFVYLFEETIKRFNYAEYDKFLLFKQQLGGSALKFAES